jgi:hypothetical protein
MVQKSKSKNGNNHNHNKNVLLSQKSEVEKNKDPISVYDNFFINEAVKFYETGEFIKSFNILENIADKYVNSPTCDSTIKMFFNYENACNASNIKNKYEYKLHEFKDVFHIYFTDEKLLHDVKKLYAFFLLRNKNYTECREYIRYLQPVYANGKNLNIHPDNMGYFKEDDTDKTLLVYIGGGIGDIIMYCRFMRKFCETNHNNNILFLVSDGLFWIFEHAYKDIPNIKIIKNSQRNLLPHYDYHTNIIMLFLHLNINYDTLYVDYYLKNLPIHEYNVQDIVDPTKKNIVINWHGNLVNGHEKYNRGMQLESCIPLFESLQNINWICVQKEVSENEAEILKKYNVKDLSKQIDNDGDIYKDTLHILKHVDLVISTDTSLVHVAATADVRCWALLTAGCDWRWTRDKSTLWYPKV